MSPMTTWSSNADLTVSQSELDYYRVRARNVDYVITACTFLQRNHQSFKNQFFAGSDLYLESLTSLASAIHDGGAQAILQVCSAGRMISPDMQIEPDIDVVSASAVRPEREGYKTPRELTRDEIDSIIQSYYDVTLRAIKVGFDGIEIHGANTCLPQQFVSPLTNVRHDEYGQDRLLFSKKLVANVLQAKADANVPNFIVGYRFSPEEREAGGLRMEHTLSLVDFLCNSNISYLHASLDEFDRTSYFDETVIATALIEKIKQRKPLIGVGKIRTKADVKRAYELGYDHVALGTTLLLNPNWATVDKPHLKITDSVIPHDIPPNMRNVLINFFANL